MKIQNNKQLALIFGAVVIIFLLLAANVFAANEQRFNREEFQKERKERMAQMINQLDLNEEQKQAFKEYKESHRGEMKALREQIKAKRQAFRELLQDPNADEATIKAHNNEIKNLMNTMADYRLEGILQVREILTPEQFQKFHELKKEHRKKRKGSRKFNQKE